MLGLYDPSDAPVTRPFGLVFMNCSRFEFVKSSMFGVCGVEGAMVCIFWHLRFGERCGFLLGLVCNVDCPMGKINMSSSRRRSEMAFFHTPHSAGVGVGEYGHET